MKTHRLSPTKAILATAFSMIVTGAAQADTVSITQTHFGSLVDDYTFRLLPPFAPGVMVDLDEVTVEDFDDNEFFYANSFDTSLGDLERVEVRYSARHGAGDRLELNFRCQDSGLINDNCERAVSDATLEMFFGLVDPISTLGVNRFSLVDLPGAGTARRDIGVFGPNGDLFSRRNMETSRDYTSPTDLAAFQTGSPVEIRPLFRPTIGAFLTCDPNQFTVITACVSDAFVRYSANYSIELTYHYSDNATPPPAPVPLPAGAPLLLVALGSLAFMRRRARTMDI